MTPITANELDVQMEPWGLWATVGLSLVVAAAFIFVQSLSEFILLGSQALTGAQYGAAGDKFGLLVAWATCLSAPVGVALTVIFAALRKGISVNAYLALNRPNMTAWWRWFVYFVLFIIVINAVTLLLSRPLVTDFEIRIFETAQSITLLIFAIVVAAPIFEEVFVRGFIFQGVSHSRVGPIGAIILTSILWAVVHIQYDYIEITMVFVGGLLLGYARWQTNSLYVPLAMHSIWNLSSSIETMIYLR